jgi:integrase
VTRDTPAQAETDASALGAEYDAYRAAWDGGFCRTFEEWREEKKKAPLSLKTLDELKAEAVVLTLDVAAKIKSLKKQAGEAPPSATVIDAALGMMSVGKRYDRDAKLRDAKESYKRRQENYIRHLERSPIGDFPMSAVQLQTLLVWWQGWCESHAPGTAARFRAWLIMLGRHARKARYWGDNLFEELPEPPKTVHILPQRVWTFEEMDALWGACKNRQDEAELVLLRAGLRQCEVIALREADCDFSACTITVRYNMGRKNLGTWKKGENKLDAYLDVPKSHSSRATIKLPSQWMTKLKKSLEQAVPCDVPCVVPSDGEHQRFVVNNVFGEFLTDTASTKRMRRLVNRSTVRAEKGESTFHAWRYALAADLVALGANDIELMTLLRHADPDISKTVYASARKGKIEYQNLRPLIRGLDDYLEAIAALDDSRRPGGQHGRIDKQWADQQIAHPWQLGPVADAVSMLLKSGMSAETLARWAQDVARSYQT